MDPRPTIFTSLSDEVNLVFAVFMAQFLTQGSITMSLSTMNLVLDDFEAHLAAPIDGSLRVWFMGSFALTVGTFILVSGCLGDIFGLKRVFLVGWAWCSIWSLITGLSGYVNVVFFIVCRAFQGIGFALLLPCGMGILGSCYPSGTRKNLAFGCVGAAGPIGAAVGCIMAAVVGQKTSWPWEFYLLAIVCLLLGVLSIWAIPSLPSTHTESPYTRFKSFDFLGCSLGISGLVLFNFVWNQAPIVGWHTPYIIALLVVSVLLIATFFLVELKVATNPLLPRAVFNYKIGLLLACIMFGWGSFGVWQYYYWNTILNFRNYSAIQGSLTYIPFGLVGVVAAFLCTTIISHIKPSFIILAASLAFMSGCIMLSCMPVHQSFFRVSFGQMLILAWGMDLSFPAASLILSDFLPQHHQGMAGSLVSTVINYSVSLFLGIASAVEAETLHRVHDELRSYRAAEYFGIGVAGLAVVCSVVFIIVQYASHDAGGTFSPTSTETEKV